MSAKFHLRSLTRDVAYILYIENSHLCYIVGLFTITATEARQTDNIGVVIENEAVTWTTE